MQEEHVRYLNRLVVAAAALILTAGAAFARPAVAEANLNVRSGPGASYPVVGVLRPGESVDVGECTRNWCRVSFAGGSGWASASYLALGGGVAAPPPPVAVYDPFYYDDFYYAPGSVFIAPGFRHRYYRHRYGGRHYRGHWGRWAGRNVVRPGRTITRPPGLSRGSFNRGSFNRAALNRGAFSRGNVGMRGGVGMRSSGGFRSGASFRSSGGGFRGGGGFARGGGNRR